MLLDGEGAGKLCAVEYLAGLVTDLDVEARLDKSWARAFILGYRVNTRKPRKSCRNNFFVPGLESGFSGECRVTCERADVKIPMRWY